MKILMIYPETPSTFWSFRNALKFISKKSSEPPLGLMTIAAMLPKTWKIKLIDMNVSSLNDKDILWADYVFLSGMDVHRQSFLQVIKRCNELQVKIVAGGPMVTISHSEFLGVDHFVLNEAEVTLPQFLADLEKGTLKKIYKSDSFPDISNTPIPRWDLVETKRYANMCVQYSRGCPYDCEFCLITNLNGHRPRAKSAAQFLAELESLFQFGWRGGVFIVDDNFIGNKKKLKSEFLPALIHWSEEKQYPFSFVTEVSINLADDDELVTMMVKAGFDHAFVGVETPNDASLEECGKKQNRNRNLVESIKKLHQKGLRVSGGFIVGFDNDPANIFDQQIDFIQKSGIVTAMVGLLNAPTGTRLSQRLKAENRLLDSWSGNNMDGAVNFIPKMSYQNLMLGYKKLLSTIYSQGQYYLRVKTFLHEYQPRITGKSRITFNELWAFVRSIWVLGILEKGKRYYWKLLFFSIFKYPKKFGITVMLAIYGFHFRQIIKTI